MSMSARKSPTLPPGLASRACALSMLTQVLEKDRLLDQLTATDTAFNALPPSDRAFVLLLIKTVLRRLGQLDALIDGFLERPLPKNTPRLRHILRLGMAQLLFLETPAHAGVHESVELARHDGFEKQTGLVNALLQRTAREGAALLAKQDAPKLNTPDWLWQRWCDAYGEDTTRAIANAHMQEPSLDLSVKENPAHWAETLGGALLPTGSVRLESGGNITQLPGFAEGAWWVQDAAASMPVKLLAQHMELRESTVLDLCAAPGGKTMQLAALGAHVTAVDISAKRMEQLARNLERTQLHADTVVADVMKWQPKSTPDAILLDAPCTATGTIRRHPDIARHRTPEDVADLQAVQARLLARALFWLKPGGRLVYAVCSLQPEEGEMQIEALLNKHSDCVLANDHLLTFIPKTEWTPTLGIRCLPSQGWDGFYMALIEKR